MRNRTAPFHHDLPQEMDQGASRPRAREPHEPAGSGRGEVNGPKSWAFRNASVVAFSSTMESWSGHRGPLPHHPGPNGHMISGSTRSNITATSHSVIDVGGRASQYPPPGPGVPLISPPWERDVRIFATMGRGRFRFSAISEELTLHGGSCQHEAR